MSIIGTATGRFATVASLVVRASPRHNDTSVEVPPMSKAIISAIPACLQILSAPTTPPAGPERIARTGSRAAISAETEPPLDCITLNSILEGRAVSLTLIFVRDDRLGAPGAGSPLSPFPSARRYWDISGTR